jgi:hypothetical protein
LAGRSSTDLTMAGGGGFLTAWRNCSSTSSSAWANNLTDPSSRFSMKPATPSSWALSRTYLLYPTLWTLPVILSLTALKGFT